MMLARYQGHAVALVRATSYRLMPDLEQLPPEHSDRRRVEAVCAIALEVKRLTGIDVIQLRLLDG